MKVIVAGCRGLVVPPSIMDGAVASLESYGVEVTEVVSGTCRGVDESGELWAAMRGLPVKRFAPDWQAYGKSAGPRRNAEMAEYADVLLAFWDGVSSGTRDMIRQMESRGKRVLVVSSDAVPKGKSLHV